MFEDAAEFGLGMRLTIDKQNQFARELVAELRDAIGAALADASLDADQSEEIGIVAPRQRVAKLKDGLTAMGTPRAKNLLGVADMLVKKSVWSIGGDGWAYDIGYGGLDHVLASGRNINLLVLDTEVYSNTGGQASKSTGLAAVAKFAAGGKATPKKDLGMMAMNYGYVYVAQVAMGSSDAQTIRAFLEAESYDGPSIVICYAPCAQQGINMTTNAEQQKLAVDSGHWILYRYDPRLRAEGKNPLQLDSREPKTPLKEYLYNENRYRMLTRSDPATAEQLLADAQAEVKSRWARYQYLAAMPARVPAKRPNKALDTTSAPGFPGALAHNGTVLCPPLRGPRLKMPVYTIRAGIRFHNIHRLHFVPGRASAGAPRPLGFLIVCVPRKGGKSHGSVYNVSGSPPQESRRALSLTAFPPDRHPAAARRCRRRGRGDVLSL